jgi:hypothetical protein
MTGGSLLVEVRIARFEIDIYTGSPNELHLSTFELR